jgi:DNA-binding transcriptional regulator YdaS (Cro superfamily)
MPVRAAIERAIKHFGSEPKLASAIGYSQHGVWRAKMLGRCTPRMAVRIETASGGQINREELCPEVFGSEARRPDGSWLPHRIVAAAH